MLAFKTTTFKQLSSCPSTSFVLFTFRAFHVFTIYQAGNSDKNILPATFVSLRQKSFYDALYLYSPDRGLLSFSPSVLLKVE